MLCMYPVIPTIFCAPQIAGMGALSEIVHFGRGTSLRTRIASDIPLDSHEDYKNANPGFF